MKERLISEKYVYNKSGLPIRIPPYLRQELDRGDSYARIQVDMIYDDPILGQRGEEDILPNNMAENIRLRKVARTVSYDLVKLAQNLRSKKYTTVVHGSVSKGLVRRPNDADPSDIDIALVLDQLSYSKDQKRDISKPLSRESTTRYGVKTDIHIWTVEDLQKRHAEVARIFLRSAAYKIANEGNLWEQIRWVGIQCQLFLQNGQQVRQLVREVMPLIAQGDLELVRHRLLMRRSSINLRTYQYLCEAGLMDVQYAQVRAVSLIPAILLREKEGLQL